MTVRIYPEPTIRLVESEPESNCNARATVRRLPPAALLRLSRDGDERPTAPAPFWVARVDETASLPPLRIVEPEPRQTTPSMVRARARSRWLSIVFAAAILAGGVGAARVFADAAGSMSSAP